MSLGADPPPAVTRGKVVMLVDNGVDGDSRVQKTARSAAEAGWSVTVLGISPDGQERSWRLGGAEVRLLPMAEPLAKPRHEYRRTWLRRPLAYPPNGIAPYRYHRVQAWRIDIQARRAGLDQSRRAGRFAGLRRSLRLAALTVESVAAYVVRKWVSLRYRQLNSAIRARRHLNGVVDRAYMYFWRLVQPTRCWRRLEPRLWNYEFTFGKAIDELAPDIIHAHDFHMLGVGARAVLRARSANPRVKLVWDAHEFLPGIKPRSKSSRWHPARCAYEREYARFADATITVSEELATLLQREHKLPERPTVVLNAPLVSEQGDGTCPNLREICGVGLDVPLLVYSGAAAPQRGLLTVIDALPQLEGVHVAFVISPSSDYRATLVSHASEKGVSDRVHVVPYVPPEQVVRFLSSADVGVIPIHHWLNHEIALVTKYFEYAHARLPVVTSDVRTMAETTKRLGNGEVFRAGDVDDFARAVRAVLKDPHRYRSAYDRDGLLDDWSWETQALVLDSVYSRLRPDLPRPVGPITEAPAGDPDDRSADRSSRLVAQGP